MGKIEKNNIPKDLNCSVEIAAPKIENNNHSNVAFWGTFRGAKENLGGAFCIVLSTKREGFRSFNLALFSNFGELYTFDSIQSPQKFKKTVRNKSGEHGSVINADTRLIRSVFDKYFLDKKNKEQLSEWLKEEQKNKLNDFFENMFGEFLRKGRKTFQVTGMRCSPGILTIEKKTNKQSKQNQPSNDETSQGGETSRNFHRAYIKTTPFEGVTPQELQPGDTIYARISGDVVENYPDFLQSDKYENSTCYMPGTVRGISLQPTLPKDHEGEPEDYVEIKVEFENGTYGRGFVFKRETVKLDSNSDKKSRDNYITTFFTVFLFSAGFSLILAVYLFVM